MLGKHSLCKFCRLKPDWGCKLMLGFSLRRWDLDSLRLELLDFLLHGLRFLRIAPFGTPVELFAIFAFAAFGCSLEDEFSDVLFGWAFNASVGKILDNGRAILSNRTEIEGVSSWVESEDHVELLNQD